MANESEATPEDVTTMTKQESQPLDITRYLRTQEEVDTHYLKRSPPKDPISQRIMKECYCNKTRVWKILTSLVPLVRTVKTYKPRQYIPGDILSGLSAAFMHLPQGLGFGILAGLTPVYGLYATFFPIMFYMIFGTSPHVSFGTNAVIAILTAGIVEKQMVNFQFDNSTLGDLSLNDTQTLFDEAELKFKVGTAAASGFVAGLILMGMGICRFGFITSYFSVSFIGGFTTAAAIHIATSQVDKMLGIKIPLYIGPGKIVKSYIAIFTNIASSNVAAVIISAICIIVLLVVKVCVNERFKAKLKIPIPIDLIIVIVGTIISHFGRLSEHFGIKIVGNIPAGFPVPAVPKLENVGGFAVDCFVLAILIFVLTIAMAKLCARKHDYEIDDNQELLAYGTTNFLSSFFHCFASCVAPPRTMILSSMGAKTTINGLFSGAFIFLVLIVAGQLFVSLPVSVLAAMIVIAMRGLLNQFLDLKRIWKVNKYDFVIWIVTCASATLIDIDIGIGVGVGTSILALVIQNQMARGYRLGKTDEEDIYISFKHRNKIVEMSHMKIFRFESSLHFANAEIFRKRLYAETVNPKQVLKQRMKAKAISKANGDVEKPYLKNGESGASKDSYELNDTKSDMNQSSSFGYVIIDFLPVNYIDMAGVITMEQVVAEFKSIDVTLFLARVAEPVLKTFCDADFYDKFSRDNIFIDLYDAVERASSQSQAKSEKGEELNTENTSV